MEDLLAYERVLLNPFTKLVAGISDQAWFMDFEVGKDTVNKCVNDFRKFMQGKPSEFLEQGFYMMAYWGTQREFLKQATDEDKLRKLMENS